MKKKALKHFPELTYFIVCKNFCLLQISAGIFANMDLRSTRNKFNTLLGTLNS